MAGSHFRKKYGGLRRNLLDGSVPIWEKKKIGPEIGTKGPLPLRWSVAMTAIKGAAAAVTGAAGGIGRALALDLAARGCDLALADRDEAGLQSVAAEINKAHSCKVSVHRVDVGEASQIADFAAAATAAHP